jgi:outer membrane lipoprotein
MFPPEQRYRTGIRFRTAIVYSLILWGLIGCASGLSDASRAMVTYEGGFSELQNAPDQYRGAVVMLGGRVVETTPSAEGSEIVVLQLPLAMMDKPALDKRSEGRFLISTPEFLDPLVYRKLTLITVVGEVTGQVERSMGEYLYTLPVLRPIEIKQWPQNGGGGGSGPNVNVGFGHSSGGSGGGSAFGLSF